MHNWEESYRGDDSESEDEEVTMLCFKKIVVLLPTFFKRVLLQFSLSRDFTKTLHFCFRLMRA